MKLFNIALSILLLGSATTPARADFKYSETSSITGGSLKGAMKFVGVFSKQASQAMKPITSTHYVKGDRLRTDSAEGQIQIIDLAGRRIITIDSAKRTYSEITFDDMKKAMENAQQRMQQKMQQDPKMKDVNANMNVKFEVIPGTGTREIMGHTATETKVKINMDMKAEDTSQAAQAQNVSGTIVTTMDMWVTPSVSGYEEIAEFYKRMAREINWVPPANIHIDPRASQSLDELQKNSGNLKGFPLIQYMTMSLEGLQAQPGNTAQSSGSSNPPSSGSSSSSSSSSGSDSYPTSLSGAMTKGLGGLFGKKKKDDAADQANANANAQPSTPGSLMEMTIETTTFSDGALDASLFDVPAGFTRIQQNPDEMMAPKPAR